MKKDVIAAVDALGATRNPATPAGTTGEKEVILTAREVEGYKRYFGAKWDRYAHRGNPYGRKELIPADREDYRRATLIIYAKQYKALQELAEAEGLTLKEAVEISLELGLRALGSKGSDDVTLTEEDTAPRWTRKK